MNVAFEDLRYEDLDPGWLFVQAIRDRNGWRSQLWDREGRVAFLCDHGHRRKSEAKQCGIQNRPIVSREVRSGSQR